MAERLYVKLWRSWWTGESHVHVGADALYVGTVLMTFVRWQPGQDDAWALLENGRPISIAIMAARARITGRRVEAGLRELEDAGTVARRTDGAWGFVNFARWQESASAAKMRRQRSVTSAVTVTTDVTPLGEEEEEEKKHVSNPDGFSPPNPQADPGEATPPESGAQILTHPTAESAAGRVASQRRRAAVDLWNWHEAERTRRLLASSRAPRDATDAFLRPLLSLHAHVRKAYRLGESEAWEQIRAYRERRLSDCERELRDGHPDAEKHRDYAAGKPAWSKAGFDYLAAKGPDVAEAKRLADEEFHAEVARRKREGRGGA